MKIKWIKDYSVKLPKEKSATMHRNVPTKFNQVCRLCLTIVGESANSDCDEIVRKLSIFKNTTQHDKNQSNVVDDDEQLKKKVKRSNVSVINNGFSSSASDDIDSDVDMTKRISQCLSLKVSHTSSSIFFLFLHFFSTSSYFPIKSSSFTSALFILTPFDIYKKTLKRDVFQYTFHFTYVKCHPSNVDELAVVPLHIMIEFWCGGRRMLWFWLHIRTSSKLKNKSEGREWIFQVCKIDTLVCFFLHNIRCNVREIMWEGRTKTTTEHFANDPRENSTTIMKSSRFVCTWNEKNVVLRIEWIIYRMRVCVG